MLRRQSPADDAAIIIRVGEDRGDHSNTIIMLLLPKE